MHNIKSYIIGSSLYTDKAKDVDILLLVDKKTNKKIDKKKNVDIHIFTFDDFEEMCSSTSMRYSMYYIVDKSQVCNIQLSTKQKNCLMSNIDLYVTDRGLDINSYKTNASVYRAMLLCMNGFKHFSKKEMQMIKKLYDDDKNTQQQIFEKWKKFIKRKRSRKIGFYCKDASLNYRELTKEEYKHEKEDSNYINIGTDDKPTIVWMSDECKQLWKAIHSSHK